MSKPDAALALTPAAAVQLQLCAPHSAQPITTVCPTLPILSIPTNPIVHQAHSNWHSPHCRD